MRDTSVTRIRHRPERVAGILVPRGQEPDIPPGRPRRKSGQPRRHTRQPRPMSNLNGRAAEITFAERRDFGIENPPCPHVLPASLRDDGIGSLPPSMRSSGGKAFIANLGGTPLES